MQQSTAESRGGKMANYYQYDYEAQRKEKEYKPIKLKTNRQMWKQMLFSILTLGLYAIFFFIPFSFDIDKVSSRHDGEKTMNYLWAHILAIFTFSIVVDIWHFHIASRVENALSVREINYDFGTKDFWLWFILGSFVLIGPFIYFHKLCTAMNLLCEDYNANQMIIK